MTAAIFDTSRRTRLSPCTPVFVDVAGFDTAPEGEVAVCGSCMDARGIGTDELVSGAVRGSMDILSTWTAEADKVIVF